MVDAAVNFLCVCVLMALIGVSVLRAVGVWYKARALMEVDVPRSTCDSRERRRGNRRTVIVEGGTFILARGDARFYGTGDSVLTGALDIVGSIEAGGRALRAISGADLVIVRG
ncbi:hypothetical protein CVT26_012687, partial [Gymnopilus dilepis]